MTRTWLAIYTAMLVRPKYQRLSPIGRGALLHVFMLAGFQSPEATWDDPEELRESLVLAGFPEGALDELIGLRWLQIEGGALVIHDWDEHQWAATIAARREWEAARKREWRHRKAAPPPAPPTSQNNNNTTQHKGPGHVPDMSQTPTVNEVVGEYQRLFGFASEKKVAYLTSISSRWPVARILEGMQREQERGATARDICGRLEAGLKRGDKVAASATLAAISDHVAGLAS
ncbi:MAG: hypothetical protein WEB29_04550 [Chloroflexota bacterium]